MPKKTTRARRIFLIPPPLFFAAAFYASLRLENAGARGALFIAACLALYVGLLIPLVKNQFGGYLCPALIAVCLLLLLRLLFFDVATSDYTDFLKPWTERLRESGGLRGLKYDIGNYNVPYLVFLAVFSYFDFDSLYLIKLLSVFFDLVLAFCLMKTVSVFTDSPLRKAVCFVSALALPTVLINGSVWGQCDSIYAAFAVMGLWLCLEGRPVSAMAAAALSLAFKLQAVFILPVFALFLLAGRLKPRHLPVFPAVYVLAVLPAVAAGRGLADTLLFYVRNASSAGGGLNYNSPSMYSLPYFYNPANPAAAGKAGMAAALLLCLIVFALFFVRRKSINKASLFFAALFFAVSIPLLLPHMHDRYFYLCDALILAAACVAPACAPLVFFSQFASLLGYHAYFFMRYLLPMRCGFAALAVLALAAAYMTAASLFNRGD